MASSRAISVAREVRGQITIDSTRKVRSVLPGSSALKETSRHFSEIVCSIFVNFVPNQRVIGVFIDCHICFLALGRSLESLC